MSKPMVCRFCNEEIDKQFIRSKSVARATTSWLVIRGGIRRRHMGIRFGNGFAHNSCVEAAYSPGQVVGQTEMWPNV